MTSVSRELCLLVRAGVQLWALPLEHVEETMRPQPVRAIGGAPPCVSGVAVIRGGAVPVVDAASLLDDRGAASRATRFVALRTADHRRVALAVEEVLGVKAIDRTRLSDLPPLLAAARQDVLAAMGMLDEELLIVLRTGRLVPDAVWTAMDAEDRA